MKPEDRYAWYMEDMWSVIVPSFYPTPSSYIPPLYILNFFILFIYLFIYWQCWMACEILAPWPGMESTLFTLEV